MEITVVERTSVPGGLSDLVRRAGLAALESEGEEGDASVVLLGDDEMASWNARWLKRQGPTDVIAFAAREGERAGEAAGDELGDVLVSVERAAAQAAEYGCSLDEELARLVIHGMLHLLGWDDAEEGERRKMAERTELILAGVIGGKS